MEVGPVAHGGHCVARHEGRVVFVRHTLPGERVLAALTDAPPDGRFWRADAVEVLEASPDRVPSAWPAAGPGGVGGGELAHVALPAQRRWKAAVVSEQLRRLARLDMPITVEPAPGDDARGGLGWRTRIDLVADDAGRAGMYRHRTHDVLPLVGRDAMPLAVPAIADLDLFSQRWPAGARLHVVAPAAADGTDRPGQPLVLVDDQPWERGRPDRRRVARTSVREVVRAGDEEYRYRVAASGFWQVHREAPAVLVGAVLEALADSGVGRDLDGGMLLDLYSGAGLLTQPLARLVGPSGSVLAVEGEARAVRDARRNAHDLPQVELLQGDVGRVLADLAERAPAGGRAGDVRGVVLDPPRVGAGRRVVERVAALAPAVVVYVACDPAALARDVAYFAERGYELTSLRGFDLFPMTHHVECVARLDRAGTHQVS
ncbi:MAG TPA: TRAM domain-containing protein [Actinomycetales bacterium]|nr:TRAM domain-containing protein [Actinomycetales bacterium]